MRGDETSLGGFAREFPSTQWSTVLSAGDASHPDRLGALNRLVEHYWKPAYHYVRALGTSSIEDAKDITQQFFAMLLERGEFEKLSPERGSFRGFLKTALRHFVISTGRSRLSREARVAFSFDDAEREWAEACARAPASSPEEAFDREWACTVVGAALDRLERELRAQGRAQHWELFQERCLGPGAGAPTYAELAERAGLKEDDVDNRLRFAREELRRILQDMLKQYVASPRDLEVEMRFILGR